MNQSNHIQFRSLQAQDCSMISRAFALQGWDKPSSLYETYFMEQKSGQRDVILVDYGSSFAGYATIVWESRYESFQTKGIPEIVDLNILQKYQRQGIGSALMNEAERRILARSRIAGIGFGVTRDYGAAQTLYVKRGYIPDGNGLIKDSKTIEQGEYMYVDDGLVLYLIKYLY